MAMYPGTLAIVDNNVGVSDICLLDPLTEDNLIHNLKQRFAHDQIYTYIGNVVVSVNPYKKIPLYTRDVIFEYRSRNIYELPPHIYAIADDAYRSMRDKNNDQCIIISGESGSGKTEASKVIMQYVAAVSGKGQDIDRVKEQLLQSNPVLEAFGNAKTNKNDNSSRFGKYMDIEFDFKGDPVGGVITNYLLEKSRVVLQSKGERNFHIFYQLLHGADTNLLKSLKLARNPEYYQFLQHGGCIYVDTIDDKQDFHITKRAMEVIGFTKQEVHSVWQLVASVLKLGNAQFIHHSNIDGTDGCRIHNDHGGQQTAAKEIYDVCDLLQTQSELLISALTQKTVQASGDKVSVDLSATEATYARDALCKAIYSRLFAWLVHRINDSIRVQSRTKRKSMGVLDIYGFEIFQCNSFEQFIINFCNEKLQQIFIELTLKEEQEEYVKEGIEWIHVDYFNNSVICELIEKSNVGILSLLDEECLRPGDVSDQTFLNKLNSQCCDHPHYESRGCKKSISDKTIPHDAFRLKHYAGEVIYRVEGFLDKNNDLLYRDLSRAMYNCDHALLKQLFPEGSPSKASLKRPPTAGSQLKASVTELMRNLLSKQPNYIRCIKPNDFKKGGLFEETLVRHQVRYLGLMENVRVRRAGYAFRQVYGQFLYRYKMLAEKTWPNWRGAHKTGVEEILTAQYIPQDEFAFGRTKIFIKNPKLLFDLEELRRERMHDLATLIQKMFRGWRMRVLFQLMKRSQIVISSNFRGYQARTRFQAVRNATITICSFIRGWKARRLLAQLKYEKKCLWAVGVIRKYYQGWKVRKEFRTKFRSNAGPKIIRFIQTALKRRFLLQLRDHLPSESPLARDWPTCSRLHRPASEEIRKIYHKWRCHKYRLRFDQPSRLKMKEKVVASDIFKDRKQNYPKSISHPYKGDYVSLRTNTRWKKVSTDYNDHHIMFADIVMKINRANGKMVPTLLVLSTNAIIIVDQRTLAYKYRLDSRDIDRISLSPYSDRIVVFHVKKYPENGNPLSKKGDFIFSCDHVIEIVAKAYLIAQRGSGKPIDVTIAHQFQAEFNGQLVDVAFKVGHPEIQPGGVKITRKSNKLEILQT